MRGQRTNLVSAYPGSTASSDASDLSDSSFQDEPTPDRGHFRRVREEHSSGVLSGESRARSPWPQNLGVGDAGPSRPPARPLRGHAPHGDDIEMQENPHHRSATLPSRLPVQTTPTGPSLAWGWKRVSPTQILSCAGQRRSLTDRAFSLPVQQLITVVCMVRLV